MTIPLPLAAVDINEDVDGNEELYGCVHNPDFDRLQCGPLIHNRTICTKSPSDRLDEVL